MKYELINLNTVLDPESRMGGLSFVEGKRDIPFSIKRIFCIYSVEKDVHRGFHAHKKNWQLLYCPYGSIDIVMTDGVDTETVTLDVPSKGLILPPDLWHEMIWNQDDSILCVAASEYYSSEDYIRDYDEFIEFQKSKKLAEIC
ncbi:MAG: sugar 3,4-ketoisomerase [Oscillospiraceae bacterium]